MASYEDFGKPPASKETSRIIEERIAERSKQGLRETFTVNFRDKQIPVEIIDIELDSLYLNPGTHRIRAQRDLKPDKDQELRDNPWGAAGQDYLRSLLMATPSDPNKSDPEFYELKENLRQEGQNDAGLITRWGVLVDGNTRAVALKELGKQTMRVGVLPADATWQDVSAVELNLQMRLDQRRDYTYINRLLAYGELQESGKTAEEIAPMFRVQKKTVNRDLWVLNQLRELVERSRAGQHSLRLMDFEEDQEKLRELHRKYEDLRATDPDAAEALKEYRLSALVLKFSKTDLRLVEDDFQSRYLDRYLREDVRKGLEQGDDAKTDGSVRIPGLNAAVTPGSGAQGGSVGAQARRLTDTLLRDKARAGGAALGEGEPEAAERLESVREAMKSSLKLAGSNARVKKQEKATAERISTAAEEIRQCSHELVQSRAKQALDVEAFDDALVYLRDSLHELARHASKIRSETGGGVEWLLNAAKRSNS
ncbi:transcriptional regulator [Streptomonospora algeriensis]|uniref:Transcriptional regulator n=1 Tax=Streptomonospora algeriensis TaxID=995084 RepID=A0ABW3BBF6_9ACTN